LDDLLFILDEVDDCSYTVGQLSQIKIPNLFTAYEEVLQSCRMILENQIYSNSQNEMKNWSLFFPMELIFEDFITGFIQAKFSDIFKIEPQKSNLYLHQSPQTFNIQHDILLTHKSSGEKIILDTKYKLRWGLSPTDNKTGVNQNDLYQMISYSYRRGTEKVILLYPNATDTLADDFTFKIENGITNGEIKIKVVDVPFWSSKDITSIEISLFTKLKNVLTGGFQD
jgi:5-methylcytosine-specific restriction enzyme subunit McrC